jgi:hypothetical protein
LVVRPVIKVTNIGPDLLGLNGTQIRGDGEAAKPDQALTDNGNGGGGGK